jgi:hypothetical protein
VGAAVGATDEATELLEDAGGLVGTAVGVAVGGTGVGAGVGVAHAARISTSTRLIHITRSILDILFFSFSFLFRTIAIDNSCE